MTHSGRFKRKRRKQKNKEHLQNKLKDKERLQLIVEEKEHPRFRVPDEMQYPAEGDIGL